MGNETADTLRVATTPLTLRERLGGLWAGVNGVPWESFSERIRGATLDHPGADAAPSERKGRSLSAKARKRVLEAEVDEVGRERSRLDAELAPARDRERELRESLPAMLSGRPPSLGAWVWVLFAGLILLGDGAFTFQALADALGLDLSAGLEGVPPFTCGMVAMMTVLACLAEVWAGIKATDPNVPIRRFSGWVLLIPCGLVLAFLRGTTTADTSWPLTLFGFLIPLIGGWAAGEAHWVLGSHLARRGAFRSQLLSKQRELAGAANNVAELEAGLSSVEERRRTLAVESERMVQSKAVNTAEAADRREAGRRILDARMTAARHVYDIGRSLAGFRADSARKNDDAR